MKELERSLGLASVVAISVSAMLGSGIFVLPGLAAGITGPSVWLAYVLAGVCVLPAAVAKAELATAMPTSGGTYVYIDRIFGPFAGTVAGIALWLSMLLKSAFALIGFGTYLAVFSSLPLKPTALVLLAAVALLNVVGIRKVGKLQVVVVLTAVVALLVLLLGSTRVGGDENLSPVFASGFTGLVGAMAFVFVSYNGVTKVAAIAEEVKDPGKNLPRGILLSLGAAMLLYGLVSFALVYVVPWQELGDDLRPVHTLARAVGGPVAGTVAALIAVITMTSMANAGLLAASRFPFAMSREQLLPGVLQRVSRRFKTPVAAIAVSALVMAIAILALDVERMAKLASALVISLYVAENAAVVIFRESGVKWYQPDYRAPLYPWMQAFGIVSGLALLIALGPAVLVGGMLVALPGVALFLLYGRRRTARRGVMSLRLGKRADLLAGAPAPDLAPEPVAMTDALGDGGSVVVALFGEERSPEMLVEMGVAVAEDGRVQVLHINEVPEQMNLADVLDEEVAVRSLRRRVDAMADEKNVDVDFHAVVSRDQIRAVYEATRRAECDWLVLEWSGRAGRNLLPANPIGSLINNVDANLALFRDAGVRYVRQIMVYAEPGPHDSLVVSTADHLAERWGAETTLVRFVPDTSPESVVAHEQEYLAQLAELCVAPVHCEVVRGNDAASAVIPRTAAHDLLVMGSPDWRTRDLLTGSVHLALTERAACSVLSVKTPRERTHEAFGKRRERAPASGPLPALLSPVCAEARVQLSRKEAAFQHFAEAFSAAMPELPPKRIVDAMWERERTQNTSVGHGVALPHATVAEAQRMIVGVFVSAAPLDWAGPDGKPVRIFFPTIGPPSARQAHLELLSRIAALSLNTDLIERLLAAETGDQVRHALVECSNQLGD